MDRRLRDKVIQAAAEVDRLRGQLAKAEAELDRLLSENGPNSFSVIAEDSVPNRVCKLLGASPGSAFNAQQIAQSLEIDNLRSLRSALARMVGRQIRSPSRGLYQALDHDFGPDDLVPEESQVEEAADDDVPF